MNDIDNKVWHAYHLGDCEPEHPLRLLIDELRATRSARDRMLQIAAENGAERDKLRRLAPRYPTFDAYFDEVETTGTRGDRFFDELEGASNSRMVEWLRAAFEAGHAPAMQWQRGEPDPAKHSTAWLLLWSHDPDSKHGSLEVVLGVLDDGDGGAYDNPPEPPCWCVAYSWRGDVDVAVYERCDAIVGWMPYAVPTAPPAGPQWVPDVNATFGGEAWAN